MNEQGAAAVIAAVKRQPPRELAEWSVWLTFLDALTQSASGRRPRTSDDDSDDDDCLKDALAGCTFLLAKPAALLTMPERAVHNEACAKLAPATMRAVVALVTHGNSQGVRDIPVSVASKLVDALKLAVDKILQLDSAAAHQIAAAVLVDLAGSKAESVKSRAIVLARRCFERGVKLDPRLWETYADFEVRVAKRPDLAAQLRNNHA
jgi:hypothetical protein